MDPVVATQIMEYMLRDLTISDCTIASHLTSLPFQTDSYSLTKSLLLRKIVSETQLHGICKNILKFLEITEELDHGEGIKATAAMKHAYCQVVVECTLRAMGNDEEYIEELEKLWIGRVSHMGECSLVSKSLFCWMVDFGKAVKDKNIRESLRSKEREIDALGAVKVYLTEAWEGLGPMVLDIVAIDGALREMLGLGEKEDSRANEMLNEDAVENVNDDTAREMTGLEDNPVPCQHPVINDGNNDLREEKLCVALSKHDMNSTEMPRHIGSIAGTSRGAMIFDTDLADNEELSKSSSEQHDIEANPLPEALQVVLGNKRNLEVPENEADSKRVCSSHDNSVLKTNLSVQNTRASTSEGGDSVGCSCRSPWILSSLNNRVVSSSNKHEMRNSSGRRIRNMWSTEEEETLRVAVKKYGEGSWKGILQECHHMFKNRTKVDLKDKWRNMTRARSA